MNTVIWEVIASGTSFLCATEERAIEEARQLLAVLPEGARVSIQPRTVFA